MINENNKDKKFEIIEILENVAVKYKHGMKKKDVFDAIHINKDGIFTGYILKSDKIKPSDNKGFIGRFKRKTCIRCYDEFIESGFIPKYNIKKIEGSNKRKACKRKL